MSETELLLSYLDAQRRHILGSLDGLDAATLHRALLPSGWTFIGLVQHLDLDVERFWFRAVVAADADVIADLDRVDNAWIVADDTDPAAVIAAYRAEIERANAVVRSTSLDAAPAWWPGDLFGDWRIDSLREVLLHVIVETANHAGHLDAARELVDEKQWLVLTD